MVHQRLTRALAPRRLALAGFDEFKGCHGTAWYASDAGESKRRTPSLDKTCACPLFASGRMLHAHGVRGPRADTKRRTVPAGVAPVVVEEQQGPTSLVARIIAELQANPEAQRLLLRALLTNEFLGMPARMDRIEKDIAELKADVAQLKTDVSALKADVTVLKSDVAELKTDMKEVRVSLARIEGALPHFATKEEVEQVRHEVTKAKYATITSVVAILISVIALASRFWPIR